MAKIYQKIQGTSNYNSIDGIQGTNNYNYLHRKRENFLPYLIL